MTTEVGASHESPYFKREAKEALKYELHRRGLTYKDVAQLLRSRGSDETVSSISQRIARGSYQMAFFMGVMSCIGVKSVTVSIPELPPSCLDNLGRKTDFGK